MEALSSGIPVVAFRVGGLPEVVEDQVNGMLVSPENTAELARACLKLLSNESHRKQLAQNGKAVVRRYGFESYKKAIGELYRTPAITDSAQLLCPNTFIAGVKERT